MYSIVVDAGSTGTRVHVYKFRYNETNSIVPFDLIDEFFEIIKPGLSSYAEEPGELRPGLEFLLHQAKKRIPKPDRKKTVITLRATAGLRLLPSVKAKRILVEVEEVLHATGLKVNPNSISIMSGLDEGLLGWITANYLLSWPSHSVGTMDLGGGSTQITFLPSIGADTTDYGPYMHPLRLGKRQFQLYSHSYLGLGLMTARHYILLHCNDVTVDSLTDIRSPCIPAGYVGNWTHGGQVYSVMSRTGVGESTFDACYQRAANLVMKDIPVHSPKELSGRTFYLFSYFFDRAKNVGYESSDNRITVGDFGRLARKACSPDFVNPKKKVKPFLCLDLVYIYSLLKDGYQFEEKTSFFLLKKIKNVELSWALGSAFRTVSESKPINDEL